MKRLLILSAIAILASGATGCDTSRCCRRGATYQQPFQQQCAPAPVCSPIDPCAGGMQYGGATISAPTTTITTTPGTIIERPGPQPYLHAQ
jgi:hypothetical protein